MDESYFAKYEWRITLHIMLTHWGRVTHKCDGNLTIIGADNGLLPSRRQAIIWTNSGILSIGPLGSNFNEISIEILTFSSKKMRLKVSSAKWRPFCIDLNEWSSNYSQEARFTKDVSILSQIQWTSVDVLQILITNPNKAHESTIYHGNALRLS